MLGGSFLGVRRETSHGPRDVVGQLDSDLIVGRIGIVHQKIHLGEVIDANLSGVINQDCVRGTGQAGFAGRVVGNRRLDPRPLALDGLRCFDAPVRSRACEGHEDDAGEYQERRQNHEY